MKRPEPSLIDNWARQFNFAGSVDYNRSFRKWDVYSQFKWDYEYRDSYGLNTTIYRQNVSWYNHVGFSNRYYLDLALVGSASSLLAPGHKWAFSHPESYLVYCSAACCCRHTH